MVIKANLRLVAYPIRTHTHSVHKVYILEGREGDEVVVVGEILLALTARSSSSKQSRKATRIPLPQSPLTRHKSPKQPPSLPTRKHVALHTNTHPLLMLRHNGRKRQTRKLIRIQVPIQW